MQISSVQAQLFGTQDTDFKHGKVIKDLKIFHVSSNQTEQNFTVNSIQLFFFSSREWLDVTAEGFELCPAKREDTLKFVHETGHPALSAPNRHPCSTTEWVVQACSDSEQKSAHKGRAAWAVKKQQNETTFYSWNFNFIWKKMKKKKKGTFHLA